MLYIKTNTENMTEATQQTHEVVLGPRQVSLTLSKALTNAPTPNTVLENVTVGARLEPYNLKVGEASIIDEKIKIKAFAIGITGLYFILEIDVNQTSGAARRVEPADYSRERV